MATLNNDDFTSIKQYVRNDDNARAEFKSWPLDKATWKALFQAMEDWFVDGFAVTPTESTKDALDAELPVELQPITNAQAKQVGRIWAQWRSAADPA